MSKELEESFDQKTNSNAKKVRFLNRPANNYHSLKVKTHELNNGRSPIVNDGDQIKHEINLLLPQVVGRNRKLQYVRHNVSKGILDLESIPSKQKVIFLKDEKNGKIKKN